MTLDLRSPAYSLSTVPSSEESPRVRAEVSDHLLTLTLDRPERRNALDRAMRDALATALDDAAGSPEIHALVITGAGGAFCAGGDLGSFEELHDARVYRHVSHGLTALLDAEAALRLGLVSELAAGDPVAAAEERARRMLRRAPLSFGAAKRLAHLAADADVRSGIVAESLAQTALLASDDHREGLAAARERRDPEFAGR